MTSDDNAVQSVHEMSTANDMMVKTGYLPTKDYISSIDLIDSSNG